MGGKKDKAEKSNFEAKIREIWANPRYRNWVYTALFFIVAGIFFIVNNANGEPESGPYPPGYFEKSSEKLDFSEYRGKVVLLDFWATWCAPCRKGIPDLIELKNKYADEEFEVIGISLDGITRGGSTLKDVVPFINEFNINYPVVFGDQQIVNSYGGIRSIPTSFVIEKDGRVISMYTGLIDKSQYEKDIEKALNGDYEQEDLVSAPNFSLPKVKVK
jgi:cytochrome c biogenesis protein CcmG/thiol:disulfide interchange protein DsbE